MESLLFSRETIITRGEYFHPWRPGVRSQSAEIISAKSTLTSSTNYIKIQNTNAVSSNTFPRKTPLSGSRFDDIIARILPYTPNAYLIENCKKIHHRSQSYPRSNSHTMFKRVMTVIHVTIGQAFQVSIYACLVSLAMVSYSIVAKMLFTTSEQLHDRYYISVRTGNMYIMYNNSRFIQ